MHRGWEEGQLRVRVSLCGARTGVWGNGPALGSSGRRRLSPAPFWGLSMVLPQEAVQASGHLLPAGPCTHQDRKAGSSASCWSVLVL